MMIYLLFILFLPLNIFTIGILKIRKVDRGKNKEHIYQQLKDTYAADYFS